MVGIVVLTCGAVGAGILAFKRFQTYRSAQLLKEVAKNAEAWKIFKSPFQDKMDKQEAMLILGMKYDGPFLI